ADTCAVRVEEQLDLESISSYLEREGFSRGRRISIEQFPGGHSNLTYLLRLEDGAEYVLRRPPLGPVAPKAHDMAREFRVLRAVHPLFPPAPRVYLVCEDVSVIGATFFLMERRRGIVLRRDLPPEFSSDAGLPRKISEAFIDCLAQLHLIDVARHGLESLG